MKLTTEQQTAATLDLVMEMAAKNMAFQEVMFSFLCNFEKDATDEILVRLKSRADDNLKLIRAKVYQYASVDPDDLLNGRFDI
jgi:hypothetical protein